MAIGLHLEPRLYVVESESDCWFVLFQICMIYLDSALPLMLKAGVILNTQVNVKVGCNGC